MKTYSIRPIHLAALTLLSTLNPQPSTVFAQGSLTPPSAPAPGMNTAARAAIRLGLDQGHVMLGIKNGFEGLAKGEVEEMQWMSVSGWASLGGSQLGTSRVVDPRRFLHLGLR